MLNLVSELWNFGGIWGRLDFVFACSCLWVCIPESSFGFVGCCLFWCWFVNLCVCFRVNYESGALCFVLLVAFRRGSTSGLFFLLIY